MNESDLDLRALLRTFSKWWWLIALCGVISAIAAFIISTNMTPSYGASVLLIVGNSIQSSNPTSGDLQTSEKLAATYAELAETSSVLNAVMKELDLPSQPTLSCSVLSSTQLLKITAYNANPLLAASIANKAAEQLILQTPNSTSEVGLAYQEFVQEQLSDLEEEIEGLTADIISAAESGDTDAVSLLEEKLIKERNTYSSLLSQIDTSTNSLQVFEYATVPTNPISPSTKKNTLLGALVGFFAAAAVIYLVDYFDDTIKTEQEFEKVCQLPILGSISDIEDKEQDVGLIDQKNLLSRYAEEYRLLNMSLKYSISADELKRSFLFTSTNTGEGKSLTVANLGSIAALAGQRVIIVGADLRRPMQTSLFQITTNTGLSSYLVGEAKELSEIICETHIEGLDLLPAGTAPPNPAELLISGRMSALLKELKTMYDLVLIDMPPILPVADVTTIASQVNGIVFVIEAEKTHFGAFQEGLDILTRAQGKPLGVVMNRLPAKNSNYARYYHYSEYKE